MPAKKTARAAKKVAKTKEQRARDSFLDQLKRRMGLGEDEIHHGDEVVSVKDVISTGHPELDQILTPKYYAKHDKGGIPRGFVYEFFGPFAGGKSSLCLMLAAEVTRNGGKVFWLDAEGSFVEDWASSHGVVLNKLYHIGPGKTGEEFLRIVAQAAEGGSFHLVVVDSVTALETAANMEKDLEENEIVGSRAKMLTRALPRILKAAKVGNCAVIFINQIRHKIGIRFGNSETTPGGEALRFYSSHRLRLSQVSGKNVRGIMKDGEEIGIRSNVFVAKSRFGPPHKETILPIYYGDVKPHPLDMLLDMALTSKVIRCRTRRDKRSGESVQHFTLEGVDRLCNIAGLDEFKGLLETLDKLEIARRLLEDKKKTFDPDVLHYLRQMQQDDDPLSTQDSCLDKKN